MTNSTTSRQTNSHRWNSRENRYRRSFPMSASLDFSVAAVRRTWIRQLLAPIDEAKWDKLVRELFAWQYATVPAFRRLCLGHEVSPKTLLSWRDIPAVPQQLFKRETLFAHGSRQPGTIYETSGTTTGQPGRQNLLGTDIYRGVSVEGALRAGLFDQIQFLHFLTPSPSEAPHSSLSAMFGFWLNERGAKSGQFWMKSQGKSKPGNRSALPGQLSALCICSMPGPIFRRSGCRAEAGSWKRVDSRAAVARSPSRSFMRNW
jgi:hypothetical protein